MSDLSDAIANSCIRWLYERDYDGKLNPKCIGCPSMDNFTECPLGDADPSRNPFAALYITKEEAISRLEKKRAEWNKDIDERIGEIRNE